MDINQLTRVYRLGHMVEDVKVRFKKNVKIDIYSVNLEGKENELKNVPRWLATVLQENGLVEIQSQDMGVELFRSLSRERIAGNDQLSTLKSDFYIRLNSFIESKQDGAEKEKLSVSMQDLVLLRLGKIIHLARSAPLNPDLEQKLTYEEKTLFQLVHKAANDFRECVLGGRK